MRALVQPALKFGNDTGRTKCCENSPWVFRAKLSGRFLLRAASSFGVLVPAIVFLPRVRFFGIAACLSSLAWYCRRQCRRIWTRSRRRLSTPPATRSTSTAGLPPPRPPRSSRPRDLQKQECSGARSPSPGCPTWRVLLWCFHAEAVPKWGGRESGLPARPLSLSLFETTTW